MPPRSVDPLKELPRLPKLFGTTPRPPRDRSKPVVRMLGPESLRLGTAPQTQGGPGEPPPGFVGAHTSATEWMVYWAIAKLKDDPHEPRQPPFTGGRDWAYQMDDATGRVPGGQVLDFAVQWGTQVVGLRIDTERWHIFASPEVHARDDYLRTHTTAVDRVLSLWDQDFVADPTGKQVIAVVQDALKGVQRPNPTVTGRAARVRP